MMTNERKRALRNHANRNIAYILDRLGVPYNDRGDGIMQSICPCLQHPGDRDNQTAWSWRVDIGKWVCWSHHCEEDRGNDIFGLVSSVKGTTFPQTIEWIKNTLEDRDIDIDSALSEPVVTTPSKQLHVHEPLAEDNLKFLQPDPQYLIDRGFDPEVLRRYEVGLWSRRGTFMDARAVFPVRDHEGHLVGYTGRTIYPKEYFEKRGLKYSKWVHGRHYTKTPNRGEFLTGSILYNLFNAKKWIQPHGRIILVEGPLDGMKLEEANIHNWVATLSTNFCHAHRTLLVKAGVRSLYVAYDNDDPSLYREGIQPKKKAIERLRRIVGDLFDIYEVELPIGKDCGDLDVDQLRTIFEDIRC